MNTQLVALSLCLILCPSALAVAQGGTDVAVEGASEGEARALFAAGREAFDGGRYAVALSRWQEAYKLSKRPELLYNLGLAYDRLRRDEEAIMAFEAFIAALPNDAHAPEVRSRIQAIRDARAQASKQNPKPAPTPAEAAATAPSAKPPVAAPLQPSVASTREEEDTPWYSRWYTWAGAGGVVVAAVVVGIVASSSSSGEVTRAKPNSGVTVQALGAAW